METGEVERGLLPATEVGIVGRAEVAAGGRFRALTLLASAQDTPRTARRMAVGTLKCWELGGLAEDVELCVSELVGNVVLHAITDRRPLEPGQRPVITLTLRSWPRWLFVEVADEDPDPPTLPLGDGFGPDLAEDLPEALLPDHGRGLHIVRTLADCVWWAPGENGGKSVVCRFDLDGGPGGRLVGTHEGRWM
ncbi:ATP-binding protein [Streptomyces solicathayae]|uniref:ATP-binding protein n=1 Tax=Streptomyces solicathayae TaxID=3081768 RepID=A0ABZ0LUW0_9ACTN|nr:ATP-binding protein [Streptomyces sp. HUAS YS2]WOX23303.1 ATP-binding protein [Streptomyces sp. HUAS YS2]